MSDHSEHMCDESDGQEPKLVYVLDKLVQTILGSDKLTN